MSGQWQRIAKKYDPLAVGSIDGTDTEPHDMGIVRAINNEYIPDASLPGDASCTLFVGRLHPRVDEEELEHFFNKYGKVKSCTVIRDIVTGFSKQYGFVEFEKHHHAERAYRTCHRTILHGVEFLVDWEFGRTMKGWKPRRMGGGFGGQKESGQLRFGCRYRQWRAPIIPEKDRSKQNK
ncbi:UNVERIFIED_CONTAM: hypothetical protein PYX00_003198 [Menopon gallinae]|uniref:U11/U12 small nuclear ribonucleoprotein 35 kDa protein n=1 Tax=Menopon gallinae TaxID=328185 RepID=A0AAW2I068_9NEOP